MTGKRKKHYAYDDKAAPSGPIAAKETPNVRAYRLSQVRNALRMSGVPAILLMNPINIRYALGGPRMAVHQLHTPSRYAIIFAEGPTIIFDKVQLAGHYDGIETIDEVRPNITFQYFHAGKMTAQRANAWAAAIADILHERLGSGILIAIDRVDPVGLWSLGKHNIGVVEGQPIIEPARAIKCDEELDLLRTAVQVAHKGMEAMSDALELGITENELWAILHHTNMVHGGEWLETKLLSSGHRTNPWFQDCSDKPIMDGEFVAFDTDMVGPNGYLADVSRTFYCGSKPPTNEQKRTYGLAYDLLQHNLEQVRAGLTLREYAERCKQPDAEFWPNRYSICLHGCGMADEFPFIPHLDDFNNLTGDGVLEENMVVCVESYFGSIYGGEGVKLEEQVIVTKNGYERMSKYPYESRLIGTEF